METLQEEFLSDAIFQLKKLTDDLAGSSKDAIDEAFLNEAFRRIHSIKGTSQVFGLMETADLAHDIEDLLHDLRDIKTQFNSNIVSTLLEGFELLQDILNAYKIGAKVEFPSEYVSRLKHLTAGKHDDVDELSFNVPESLLTVLTPDEKASLSAALKSRNQFFVIELFLLPAEIYQLKAIKETLLQIGKVIAVSASKVAPSDRLGFHIYFAGSTEASLLEDSLRSFDARIIYPEAKFETSYAPDMQGALAQIVSSGEKAAGFRGKKITFNIASHDSQITGNKLRSINEILIHLVRNAIDHGIESPAERIAHGKTPNGNITIDISPNEDSLNLVFEDDGRGIDLGKIRQKMSLDEPDNKELLNFIFTHGFTTRDSVSNYSGRGVGLDIVKQIIDQEGGSVEVFTEPGKGTSFRIRLSKPASS